MTDASDEETTAAKPPKPRARPPIGLAAATLVIALVALGVAACAVWQLQRSDRAADAARKQSAATIVALENRLTTDDRQVEAGGHRLDDVESRLEDLRASIKGLDRRIGNLETAYANLSGQQQSGHDTLLLNDAEMLLRTGGQRYALFHDSGGALKAYSEAIEVLAQVQNPVYAPVRASVITERDALAAAAPPSRQAALDTLSALRGKVAALPPAMPAPAGSTARKPGFWSRIAGAFSGVVTVSRENGDEKTPVDARLARQKLALDLAQAQESLLAFDDTGYRASLQQAATTLAAFDADDAGVEDMRAQLSTLLAQRSAAPPPKLGGALAQLISLRAGQQPALPAPAPAASAGAAQP